ncbi:MAG: SAF domain-containing protein [Myxococcales bacterium]|nr:SAF domain-containing protein [Myxococcales bacterium]
MSAPARSTMVLGLVLGAVVGLVAGLPVAFLVAWKRSQPTVDAWRLAPVVVAAVDVLPGAPLTMEVISQRSIPVRFVSAAYVKPDSASYVVDGRVKTPLAAGVPLSWWMVDEPHARPAAEAPAARACGKTARSLATDSTTREVWRVIDALEQQDTGSRR